MSQNFIAKPQELRYKCLLSVQISIRQRWIGLMLCLGVIATGRSATFIRFSNLESLQGVNAPFYDSDGSTRLAGTNFAAMLYIAREATPNDLAPISLPQFFRTGVSAGYWVSTNVPVNAAQFPPGSRVLLEVRFWEIGRFSSFDAALQAGVRFGISERVPITLPFSATASAPSTIIYMVGLQSASLVAATTLTRGTPQTVTSSTQAGNVTNLCGVPVRTSQWFKFWSPTADRAHLTTTGSSIDTVISAHLGSAPYSIVNLSPALACNDNRTPGDTASEVLFPMDANRLYLVCVAGKGQSTGVIRLNYSLGTTLRIRSLPGRKVELSWPRDATGFYLQSATQFPGTISWQRVSNSPVVVNDRYTMETNALEPRRFFRLRLDGQ